MAKKQTATPSIASITIDLPVSLFESLKAMATKQGVSLNTFVKTILADRVREEYARKT